MEIFVGIWILTGCDLLDVPTPSKCHEYSWIKKTLPFKETLTKNATNFDWTKGKLSKSPMILAPSATLRDNLQSQVTTNMTSGTISLTLPKLK